MGCLTTEEKEELLSKKPILTDPRSKIIYAVFFALVDKGWKGVGAYESGVMTKNGFVLTLFKSDASRYTLREPDPYLVPAAITMFNVPNVSWVLERYNKIYDSGKIPTFWDFLYDSPEDIDKADNFQKFINQVDEIAEKHELELQSIGSFMAKSSEVSYQFSQYSGNITDTGLFMSLVDFAAIHSKSAYKILNAKDTDEFGKVFVLQQIQPPSSFETILRLSDFSEHYQNGDLIPLQISGDNSDDSLILVEASGAQMGGIPKSLRKLNFSKEKQEMIGIAIEERRYIIPLLKADDSLIMDVLSLVRCSCEYEALLKLPDDRELLHVLVDYAKAGYSIWDPLMVGDANEARFELNELIEANAYDQNSLRQEYGNQMYELITFLKTHYMRASFKPTDRPNYVFLDMLARNNILLNLTSAMQKDTITDQSGTLYLHKVYMDFNTQNELRAFFSEPSMEDIFEKVFSECAHVTFDWRSGFGLSCHDYTLLRVPCGYAFQVKDKGITAYMLRVNDETFSYGDIPMK